MSAWTHMICWLLSAVVAFFLKKRMEGSGMAWNLIASGIFLYGIRVGYKLLPFYKASTATETMRYVIGIVALLILFIGILKYYYNKVKPLMEMVA